MGLVFLLLCFAAAGASAAIFQVRGGASRAMGGTTITSFTLQNGDPSNAVTPGATGYPIVIGQAWARGDLPTIGSPVHPICQDHSNGAPLQCQFDQIATNRENGDDGSWRHAAVSLLLPSSSPQYSAGSVAACTASPCPGTFQIDFVTQSGAYVPNVHGSIADICNGHDIKLVLTDVRNQDDSLRGPIGFTGTLTFDTCVALGNTGRDAPRQFAQGAVRNGWLVQGPPLYGNGAADPLLYVKCYMGQTYTLGGALGPLEHECSVHNSWMNVAAGSAGNSGAPGPVGLAGDPQAVTYRPVLYDGATAILDWGTSYWDETVANTALNTSTGIWTISALGSATSAKAWGYNNSFRYTASATPPTATQGSINPFQNGKLLYTGAAVNPNCGPDGTYDATHRAFSKYAAACFGTMPTYTAQGTGNSTFSWRVTHPHWAAWVTDDVTGLPNWAPAGSTTRYVSLLQPQFTSAQKTYWYTTGQVPPLDNGSTAYYGTTPALDNTKEENTRYAPVDLVGFQLGTGVGGRFDIGLQNEYTSRWWTTQSPSYWQMVNASSFVGLQAQGAGDLLNEVTARLPAGNNGAPASNHGGGGTPYTGLGALFPGLFIYGTQAAEQVAAPLENVPYNDCGGCSATSQWANFPLVNTSDNTHQSAYALGVYQVTGREVQLEALQAAAGRAVYNTVANCTGTLGFPSSVSGDETNCTLASGVHYYAIMAPGAERRGSAWAMRDVTVGSAYGGDTWAGAERQYFDNVMTETFWADKDCGPPGSLYCGLVDPAVADSGPVVGGGVNGVAYNLDGTGTFTPISNPVTSTFFDSYITQSAYLQWALTHTPIAKDYLIMQYRLFSALCADGGTMPAVAGSPSSILCATYYYGGNLKTMTPSITVNLTDAADWQTNEYQVPQGVDDLAMTSGSATLSVTGASSNTYIAWQPFTEKVKFYNYPSGNGYTCSPLPSQLVENTWYYLVNNLTYPNFQVATTPGGTPLVFTSTGTLCGAMYRWDAGDPQTMPGSGGRYFFLNPGYASYALAGVTSLVDIATALGLPYSVANAQLIRNNMLTRYNNNADGWTYQNAASSDVLANHDLDPTIVVK